MTLKNILEQCYSIDLDRTCFAFKRGAEKEDEALIRRSIEENDIVIESLTDEYPDLAIDDVEVDDYSCRTRLFVI